MFFTSIKRVFKLGWLSFSRDGGLVLANIFIMVMTIALISSLFLFRDISQFVITNLQEKMDISVYFKFETPEESIFEVQKELSQIPEVKEVKYVSREEALEKFKGRHRDNPILMESLEEVGMNPFLASLNVKAFEASQYEAVASFLESPNFNNLIEKVDYFQRKPIIERIFSLTSNFNKVGIAFSILLTIVAILVAFNTIRLAIYNSREEIKIQRLVGASNWFIRGPFLVQGVIVGLFSAFICLFLFTVLAWSFGGKMEIFFPGLNLFKFFLANFWLILLIQLVTGIGLGIIASFIAVRRYLEV